MKFRAFHLILITLLLCAQHVFAQKTRQTITLSGTLSDSTHAYPIKMTLAIQHDSVYGYYYHEKDTSKIWVMGKRFGDEIMLSESPEYENDFTKVFDGNLKQKKYKGTWYDKDNNKALKFNLSVDSDKQDTLSKRVAAIEGNYENIQNSDDYDGGIFMRNIHGDAFYFKMVLSTKDGCTGFVQGLVELNNLSKGKFLSTCERLSFAVTSDTIQVQEIHGKIECRQHGANCPFDGTYKKN